MPTRPRESFRGLCRKPPRFFVMSAVSIDAQPHTPRGLAGDASLTAIASPPAKRPDSLRTTARGQDGCPNPERELNLRGTIAVGVDFMPAPREHPASLDPTAVSRSRSGVWSGL
jgi:hypothetical protein